MRFVLFCLSLLGAVNVFAESEYWVSVASSKDLNVAERLQHEAEAKFPEPFSLQPTHTSKGFYYRVVTGPFLSQAVAQRLVEDAKPQGFASAWLFPVERQTWSEPVGISDRLADPKQLPEAEPEERLLDLPAPMDTEKPERAVIDKPPPGYKLNKLNKVLRDQAGIDWHSPFLLASNSNSVLSAALSAQAAASAATAPALESGEAPTGGVEVDFQTGDLLTLQQWDHSVANIKIDGRVDEPAWAASRAVNLLKVVEPETLDDPLYETDIRMFYTPKGIYISFDMEQPQETLVKRLSFRDAGRLNRDYVSFTLDTSGQGRYAYWMNLALGDNQVDGTALPERQYSINWDGAWYGATTETERGWSAEYFVPWSQMTMPKAAGVRRLGFYGSRQVAHLNQKYGWPPYPRSQAKFLSVLQPLEVTGVNPRQQWSLFPYASTTVDEVGNDTDVKAGFDLFWRPSTNLQLTATANPDFGTVEADDVVVNLSAFETFFPEKRLFFLEGREIFQETPKANVRNGAGAPVSLLNTRRIGSSPDIPEAADGFDFSDRESGQLTDLYGAAKVTGQVGRFRYGVMTAFEEDTNINSEQGEQFTADGRDYGIGRVLYENTSGGEYRALGLMSTATVNPERDAYTNGLDYHFLSSSGLIKLDGEFMHSYRDGDGNGFGGFMDLVITPRTGLKHALEFTHYEDDLEINDLGFLYRNNVTGFSARSEWIESGLTRIRDFKVEPFVRYEENGAGEAVRSGMGTSAHFTLNSLSEIEASARYFPKRYDDRNSFDNGSYKIQDRPSFSLGYKTDTAKVFSYFANAKWEREPGDYGYFYEGAAGVFFRPIDRVSLQASTYYRVRNGWLLHQEDQNMTSFDTEEWGPKVELDFFLSAKQQFRVAFQWVGIKAFEDRFYQVPDNPGNLIRVDKPDAESDSFSVSSLNFQARYRWEIAPLSDLFIVYTKFASDNDLPLDNFSEILDQAWSNPVANQLVVKLRYRLGS
jgi:hypothetical protein